MSFTATLELTCLSCGGRWEIERRQGQYPNRCLHCTATEVAARHLAKRARQLGLRAQVDTHPRQGTVCVVATPWHDELVIVRDPDDLVWLLTEMGQRALAEVIAA